MTSYIRLMHPLVGASVAVATYVAALLAGSQFIPEQMILWAMLAVFLITSGGMALNDVADSNTDKTNYPKRPIPSGNVSRGKAITWAAFLLAAGNFISFYFLTLDSIIVTLLVTAVFVAYTTAIKRVPIASNVIASVLATVAIFFGGFLQSSYNPVIPLMAMTFLIMLTKEIYKNIDLALGEKHSMHSTIATKLGVIRARMLGNIIIAATVIASFALYFSGMVSTIYLFFAVIADIIIVAAAVSPLRLSSSLIKISLILMFIAFLADAYNIRYIVGAV